jgi:hypothetical protein
MSRMSAGFDPSYIVPPKPKQAPLLGGTRGLTGSERRMAKNAPLVEWLVKVYREMAEHEAAPPETQEKSVKPWVCFDFKTLGGFLVTAGADLSAQAKSTAAHEIPPDLGAPEGCVKALQGAPFLTGDPRTVCAHLTRRRAMARL